MDLQTPESLTIKDKREMISENPISEKDRLQLEKALPLWKIVFNQFREHRMAVLGSFVILIFICKAAR